MPHGLVSPFLYGTNVETYSGVLTILKKPPLPPYRLGSTEMVNLMV